MFDDDLIEPTLEHVRMVLQAANECDPSIKSSRFESKFVFDFDSFLTPIVKDSLEKELPDLDESEIDFYVRTIIQEVREKQEIQNKEAAREKANLIQQIKEIINYQAQSGWELAYQMCSSIVDDEAKAIRYRLCKKIPGISLREKISVCEEFAISIENNSTNYLLDSVYIELAELYMQLNDSESQPITPNIVSDSLDKAFRVCKDEKSTLNEILRFCNKHNLLQERTKWESLYLDICLDNPTRFTSYFIWNLIRSNNISVIKQIVYLLDDDLLTPELFEMLIRHEELDIAETVLDRMEIFEEGKGNYPENHSARLAWIESEKYLMKYYRMGYFSIFRWTPVHFFDYVYASDKVLDRKISKLKQKYKQIVSTFRCCQTDIYFYKSLSAENKANFFSTYLDACERLILIIPQLLPFFDEFRNLVSKENITKGQIYNMHTLLYEDKYKCTNCEVFKTLAIYYEKLFYYDEALRVCNLAISCGYLDDGTKAGMLGRKNRLLKKRAASTKV